MLQTNIRVQLAEYLEGQATWRETRAEEHPGDTRSERAANGLRELAADVRKLPDDDPVLIRLAKLGEATSLDVTQLMPSHEATSGVNPSRFRFRDSSEPGREFLEQLVEGAENEVAEVYMSELGKHIEVTDESDR